MQIEAKCLLFDMQKSIGLIEEFTKDVSFDRYRNNAMMRSAVERQFEIIGEAVNRLSKLDRELASRISARRRIINFRNQLIHGYSVVDNRAVWDVIQTDLPTLAREVKTMMSEE